MIYNLNELNIKKEIEVSTEVFKDDDLDKRILDLKNSKVVGKIYLDSINDIWVDIEFTGVMYLMDSITLDSIPYNFCINIQEKLDDLVEFCPECFKKSQNILDLKPILWQNIVLEVPISYSLSEESNIKGEGWELKSELASEEIDPRLEKLNELLKGDD